MQRCNAIRAHCFAPDELVTTILRWSVLWRGRDPHSPTIRVLRHLDGACVHSGQHPGRCLSTEDRPHPHYVSPQTVTTNDILRYLILRPNTNLSDESAPADFATLILSHLKQCISPDSQPECREYEPLFTTPVPPFQEPEAIPSARTVRTSCSGCEVNE